MTMPISVDTRPHEAFKRPNWCPECGESNPGRYPVTMPGDALGCRTCNSIWTPEKLAELCEATPPFPSTINLDEAYHAIAWAIDNRAEAQGRKIPITQLGPSMRFREELGLNTTDVQAVAAELAEKFKVRITSEQLQYCHRVNDMAFLVRLLVASNRRRDQVGS